MKHFGLEIVVAHFGNFAHRTSSLKTGKKFNQSANAESSAAFRAERVFAFSKGRARDIEVCPGKIADKFLQNQRGRDRAGVRATDIFNVSDTTLDHILVFFYQRQLPQFLTGVIRTAEQSVSEGLMIA